MQVDVKKMTAEEKERLLAELQADKKEAAVQRRNAYEGIRKDVVSRIMERVEKAGDDMQDLFDFVRDEMTAFYDVMNEYGQLRQEKQMSYKITDEDSRIEVKTNKVKKFDERAELATRRLIDFLRDWIKNSDKGTDDPMYQLAMSFIQRNRQGDLDYKSISKLYDMEDKFKSPVYSEIMQLYRESHRVEGTATNYYFSKKDEDGVWRKIEISFNRL